MSRIFERGMAWHTYLNLEKDFTDTIRYVALDMNNRTVWSEKPAQQLLLTGSILDSVFNEMRRSSLLPLTTFPTHANLQANPQPNIRDYRNVYEAVYQLSGIELEAHFGLTTYGRIKPFAAFAQKRSPEWWDSYNDVKHDWDPRNGLARAPEGNS